MCALSDESGGNSGSGQLEGFLFYLVDVSAVTGNAPAQAQHFGEIAAYFVQFLFAVTGCEQEL